MFTAGIPADNPAAGAVLVTSRVVTTPRRTLVRITVASEINVWVTVIHRNTGGAALSTIFLPVNGTLLGPLDLYETYFGEGDYVEVAVRAGVPAVIGTVQASVELR